jgi:glycosyltransferase involved in cell wall biosynthesis
MKIIIAAENASNRMGGEAARPLQYFQRLVSRGHECYLVVHERCRNELLGSLADQFINRIVFAPEHPLQTLLFKIRLFQVPLLEPVRRAWCHYITEKTQCSVISRLIQKESGWIIHVPTPIAPRIPCRIFNLGAPVVIGPLNGDMHLPPGFRTISYFFSRSVHVLLRKFAYVMNLLIPGKRKAELILVSNERTLKALPFKSKHKPVLLIANALNCELWKSDPNVQRSPKNELRACFTGRLVWLKGVDMLLEALSQISPPIRVELDVIGDGPEMPRLRKITKERNLESQVRFHGWLSHQESSKVMQKADVFAFPSVLEAGGAAVIEAMALGLPVIALNWGGPPEYMGQGTGILIEPTNRAHVVLQLKEAMEKLAVSPELRESMGKTAAERAHSQFDWEQRIDALELHYTRLLETK